jgi:Na+ dependent nucleoside transporter N-terminus
MEHLISLFGLVVFVGIAYLFSVNWAAIRWPTVLWGISLQLILALFILKTPIGLAIFEWLGNLVQQFLDLSDVGAKFVFGDSFAEHFVAFKVLPTIVFMAKYLSRDLPGEICDRIKPLYCITDLTDLTKKQQMAEVLFAQTLPHAQKNIEYYFNRVQ